MYEVYYCSECGAELPEVVVWGNPDNDYDRDIHWGKCYHNGDGGVIFLGNGATKDEIDTALLQAAWVD